MAIVPVGVDVDVNSVKVSDNKKIHIHTLLHYYFGNQ